MMNNTAMMITELRMTMTTTAHTGMVGVETRLGGSGDTLTATPVMKIPACSSRSFCSSVRFLILAASFPESTTIESVLFLP